MHKPIRLRSTRYLSHIRGKPCLHCGQPGEPHHIQYAQPRAMGKKTGDQWVVPLCRKHHDELHQSSLPEPSWWATKGILPMVWAQTAYTAWAEENEGANVNDLSE